MFADMFSVHMVSHTCSPNPHRDTETSVQSRPRDMEKTHAERGIFVNAWAQTLLTWARELACVSHGPAMSSWQPHDGVWRDGDWQQQTQASSSGGDGRYGRGDAVHLAKRPGPGMDFGIGPGPGMHDGGGKGVGPGHNTYGLPAIWYAWTGEHEHARQIGFQQGLQKGHQKGLGIGFGNAYRCLGHSVVEQEPEGEQVATRKQ